MNLTTTIEGRERYPVRVRYSRELRAQIELAIKYIPQLSHISDHMNVASCRPDIRELVDRLAKEYNLPLAPDGLNGSLEIWAVPPEEKEGALADSLGKLA